MFNQMNRAKAGALVIALAASGFALTPFSRADDDDCSQACGNVLQQAQQLPSPNAKSVRDYLNRVTDAAGQCLQCAENQVQGQPAPDSSQQPAPDNSQPTNGSGDSGSSSGLEANY